MSVIRFTSSFLRLAFIYVFLHPVRVHAEHCGGGTWGAACANTCPQRCRALNNIVHCDSVTGECLEGCQNGWFGSECNLPCSENCVGNICNAVDGECTSGCYKGCSGIFCDNCITVMQTEPSVPTTGMRNYICSNRRWGETCDIPCPRQCLSYRSITCNETTGFCTYGCQLGWHGVQCQHQCSASCLNSTCHQHNGTCASCNRGICGDTCSYMCDNDNIMTSVPSPMTLTGTLSFVVSGVLLVLVTCIVVLQCRNHHSNRQECSTGQTGTRGPEHNEANQSNPVALRNELNTCDGSSYWQIDESRFDAGHSEQKNTEVRKSGLSDCYTDCISLNKSTGANVAIVSSIVCDDNGMLFLDENASDVTVRYVTPQPSE